MATKITGVIPAQNFEAIRDAIAALLVLELAAQTITASVKVWKERTIPFDLSELPAVNIYFDGAIYSDHNPKKQARCEQIFNRCTYECKTYNRFGG